MTLPVTIFTWIMAVLPILVLLVLMVKLQMGAVKAAPIGLCVSAVSALIVYKASISHVFMEMLKGVWSALPILIVVWTAILLYEVVNEAKAFQVFRKSMGKVTQNELLQIMLLAMGIYQLFTGNHPALACRWRLAHHCLLGSVCVPSGL